jgi:type VII secretion integral membrane protein EccD
VSELTKITVLGDARRVTLVIPADEPLGAHLAEVARLLEQPAARAALLTPYGEQLDLALAPTDQGVLDGAVLRLVDVERLPAPPEVTDVTDRVAELRDTAAGTWDARHALVGAAAGAGALSLAGGLTLSALAGGWAAVVLLVVAALGATAAGLLARPAAATLLLGVALGASYPAAGALLGAVVPIGGVPGIAPVTTAIALVIPFTIGLAWLVIAVAVGAGRRSAAAALGAAVGILLTLAAALPPLLGVGLLPTAGIVATIGILALGVLPSLALVTSGLAALDDEVIAGSLPARERVATSLRDAFRASDAAVVAVAVWLVPTVALLLGSGELWSMLLGGAVALVAVLRTRVLPTAVASWALWVAAVAGALLGILASPAIPPVARLVIAAVGVAAFAVLALARPTVQGRIRLRRLGDVVESLAAVALVPFLLGSFGVYGFLLGVFA